MLREQLDVQCMSGVSVVGSADKRCNPLRVDVIVSRSITSRRRRISMAIIINFLEGGKNNPNNDMTLIFEGRIKRIPCGVPDNVRVVDL